MMIENGNLRNSMIASTCLHLGALLFLYFGLPVFIKPLPAPWRPIPVDIVEIGEITNTRIRSEPEEEARPSPPEPRPLPPAREEIKPQTPEAKPAEPPKQETPDEAAFPEPKTKPKPPPPEPPKPQAQAQQDQLASVLKNVARLKPAAPKTEPSETADKGETPNGAKGNFGPALSDRLTISAEDALRRQISQCWNMPVGARNAETLVVEVLIEVNPDRTVQSAQVVDQMRLGTDPYFRAAAESALRALRNPKCSPLELPPDQYEQWKTIRFNFDPRDML